MKQITQPTLVCIFAESIRTEQSGQSTIIGTYMGRAVQFPAIGPLVLPTFAVQCVLEVPLDLELRSIGCELMLDDNSLETINLPPDAMQAFTKDRADQIAREPGLGAFPIFIALQMGNFVIPQPGFLRVKAQVNEHVAWSNSLHFAPPDARTS